MSSLLELVFGDRIYPKERGPHIKGPPPVILSPEAAREVERRRRESENAEDGADCAENRTENGLSNQSEVSLTEKEQGAIMDGKQLNEKMEIGKKCFKAVAKNIGAALQKQKAKPSNRHTDHPILDAVFDAGVQMLKDVVDPSVRRKNLRELVAKSGVEIPLSSVKPGAVMLVELAFTVEHTGIYLGGRKVAELHGSGRIERVDFKRFLEGKQEDPLNPRTGERIFVACAKAEDGEPKPLCDSGAAAVAEEFVGSDEKYNLLVKNCHLFSATCLEHSRTFAPSDSIMTIDCLESVIAKSHGVEGNSIFWLPVQIPPETPTALEM